jgi:hypothetical protein
MKNVVENNLERPWLQQIGCALADHRYEPENQRA